jgi:hypothetical protein
LFRNCVERAPGLRRRGTVAWTIEPDEPSREGPPPRLPPPLTVRRVASPGSRGTPVQVDRRRPARSPRHSSNRATLTKFPAPSLFFGMVTGDRSARPRHGPSGEGMRLRSHLSRSSNATSERVAGTRTVRGTGVVGSGCVPGGFGAIGCGCGWA